MTSETELSNGICHECLKLFELKDEYLIPDINFKVWECPHCDYPNSKTDCLVTGEHN